MSLLWVWVNEITFIVHSVVGDLTAPGRLTSNSLFTYVKYNGGNLLMNQQPREWQAAWEIRNEKRGFKVELCSRDVSRDPSVGRDPSVSRDPSVVS